MSPSLGPDPEKRVLELIDQRARELLRGDALSSDVQPRSLRVDRLRPSGVAGSLLTDNGKEAAWKAAPANVESYIGTYNYIPVTYAVLGTVVVPAVSGRRIFLNANWQISNYGSGLTLATSFLWYLGGVGILAGPIRQDLLNNAADIGSIIGSYVPTATQIGTSLSFELQAAAVAHPAIGTTGLRLQAIEVG